MEMIPVQSRMARAALGWSIDKLAEAAGLRAATVSSYERGGDCYASTVAKLREALELGGVMFIAASPDSGPGVRLRK